MKASRQKSSLPATAAPTASPRSNSGPQVLIDLTSNEDENRKGKNPKSSNQMHKKQGKVKKQMLYIVSSINKEQLIKSLVTSITS